MPPRNLLILFLAAVVSYACYVRGEQNPYARYVADGLTAIEDGALDPVPNRELFDAAMEGMVGALRARGDAHSQYLPEEEATPLRTDIRQQFGGIGVRIGFEGDPPQLVIVGPPDAGTPADRANLLPGDRILAIDLQPTESMSMTDVLARMRGQPGTTLKLSIQHEHATQPRSIELVREVIEIESILGDRRDDDGRWIFRLESDPRIAHLRIILFGDRTAAEFAATLEQVTADGAAAVALDLRDNAGGALDAAVAVCEMFLPDEKAIVETRGRNHTLRQRYATSADGRWLDLPVAVLVNRNSASAAEIVAACLQDHDRAVVGGERTYGKGTVQQLIPLETGRSLLKLTWASFWRPSGQRIHRPLDTAEDQTWGVMPDSGYQLPLTPEKYLEFQKHRASRDTMRRGPAAQVAETGEPDADADYIDEQLQLAVEHLRGELDKPSKH